MNNENEKFTPTRKLSLLGAALALLMAGTGTVRMQAQAVLKKSNAEGQPMTTKANSIAIATRLIRPNGRTISN